MCNFSGYLLVWAEDSQAAFPTGIGSSAETCFLHAVRTVSVHGWTAITCLFIISIQLLSSHLYCVFFPTYHAARHLHTRNCKTLKSMQSILIKLVAFRTSLIIFYLIQFVTNTKSEPGHLHQFVTNSWFNSHCAVINM